MFPSIVCWLAFWDQNCYERFGLQPVAAPQIDSAVSNKPLEDLLLFISCTIVESDDKRLKYAIHGSSDCHSDPSASKSRFPTMPFWIWSLLSLKSIMLRCCTNWVLRCHFPCLITTNESRCFMTKPFSTSRFSIWRFLCFQILRKSLEIAEPWNRWEDWLERSRMEENETWISPSKESSGWFVRDDIWNDLSVDSIWGGLRPVR